MSEWERGFSQGLKNLKTEEVFKEAIGRTLVCDDGIARRVVEICSSSKFPWMFIINEQDPESKSGHWINVFSCVRQVDGYPAPTKEINEAFIRAVRVNFSVNEDGTNAPKKQTLLSRFTQRN